ncbi:MAG: PHB depolymerase family esterase, partial [Myxococcaceae bacterium]
MPRVGDLAAAVLTLAVAGCGGEPAGTDFGEPQFLQRTVGALEAVSAFGSNPGALKMYKYVPANVPQNAPLVVAMHGCDQDARAYEQVGWNELADKHKFYVLYPEQPIGNNPMKCFNWAGEYGDPTNLRRGQGENLSIKEMVDKMKADHSIDATRVFVTGLSAGGAEVALMLATWPEVFSAGAIIAGLPFHCATTLNDATSCMNNGKDLTPAQWAKYVTEAHPAHSGAYPRVSIWQGTQDAFVKPINSTELVDQWTAVHGIDQKADAEDTLETHPRKAYKNASGQTVVELIQITGMGHGTPVDPSSGCGTAGSYRLNVGVCSSEYIAEFFGITGPRPPPGGDKEAPVVEITEPAAGATVGGQTVVKVTASDNVAVAKVELFLDAELIGTDASAPFEFAWNTGLHANGSYTLTAKAHDAAGNVGTDADTTVTVDS